MKHCMLDLETWGTAPGSALRSIGAVMFELDGRVGKKFYANIDLSDQLKAGLVQDGNTVEWWKKQDEDAQQLLSHAQQSLRDVAEGFHKGFIADGGVFLWGNGANFDPVLWEVACRAVGVEVPWKFWNVRCCRTWCFAHKFNPKTVPFEGVKHYALDDALHQIKYVQATGGVIVGGRDEVLEKELAEQMLLPGGNTFGMV